MSDGLAALLSRLSLTPCRCLLCFFPAASNIAATIAAALAALLLWRATQKMINTVINRKLRCRLRTFQLSMIAGTTDPPAELQFPFTFQAFVSLVGGDAIGRGEPIETSSVPRHLKVLSCSLDGQLRNKGSDAGERHPIQLGLPSDVACALPDTAAAGGNLHPVPGRLARVGHCQGIQGGCCFHSDNLWPSQHA